MQASNPSGKTWTEREIDLIIADHFDMLRSELAGENYNKAAHNRQLQGLIGRTKSSIEFKHQNISAVLELIGIPWIRGYVPRWNYQSALFDGVERFLNVNPLVFSNAVHWATRHSEVRPEIRPHSIFELGQIFMESPPKKVESDSGRTELPSHVRRLVRKFDPAARDEKNRILGRDGEELVLARERAFLIANDKPELAKAVRWVSEEDGDGAGFDIHSYSPTGVDRLLEVKTTRGGRITPFYLSENERSLSVEQPDKFKLVRIYNFDRDTRGFELVPPLESSVLLRPTEYRASFQ